MSIRLTTARILVVGEQDAACEALCRDLSALGCVVVGFSQQAAHAIELAARTTPTLAVVRLSRRTAAADLATACALREQAGLGSLLLGDAAEPGQGLAQSMTQSVDLAAWASAQPVGYLRAPHDVSSLRAVLTSALVVAEARASPSPRDASTPDASLEATRILAHAARTVVHDVNNVLSAVRCSAYLIHTEDGGSADARDASEEILAAVDRGERSIAELAPIARAYAGTSHALTVRELSQRTSQHTHRPSPIPPADPATTQARSVLVVDDDPAVRRGVVRSLRSFGLRVLEAGGGTRALDLLAREPIALLLTDLIMPELTGYELAERARALHPGVRIVFMSGYAPFTSPAWLAGEHAPPEFLQKPFAVDVLRRMIAGLLPPDAHPIPDPLPAGTS